MSLLRNLTAPVPSAPLQIVVPHEEYDRPSWLEDAGRLADLFLEGHRLTRSVATEREMLDFVTIRIGEKAVTIIDRPGQTHYEWLRENTLETLSTLRASLAKVHEEIGVILGRVSTPA